jgi:hypothetical protein
MKIDITTTTVFALFYAIMFGGMLNRLSDWSAFAREDKKEEACTVFWRVLLSYVLLHGLPAIYFASAVGLLSNKPAPTGIFTLSLWSVAIFFSVLFVPTCYRAWCGIVIWFNLHSVEREEAKRHWRVPPRSYFGYAALTLGLSLTALLVLLVL